MRAARILLLAAIAASAPLPAGAAGGKSMELFSSRGRRKRVKIYSGESVTFIARERREGLPGIFDPGEGLRDVTFRLRTWPRVKQDSVAIAKGANRTLVREQKPPPDLWGIAPASFTVEGGGKPGRYVLEAEAPGYAPSSVEIHLATFEIVDIEAELDERSYTADFHLRLIDPDERGKPIPLLVETLDEAGRLLDRRKDVVLAPVMLRSDFYRSSRRIRLSSTETEAFRARLARAEKEPLPAEFFDQKAMRIAEGGMLRVSFRGLHAVYALPLGY